jgi:hypothetical protein
MPGLEHLPEHWLPATFRERGVAVGFTTPVLAGARVRLVERRCDLIVPYPGGARGVYIFLLASLAEFCCPTMHDFRLAARLAALGDVSPGSVRAAARAVALEGAAGRAAAAASAAAEAGDAARRTAFQTILLISVAGEARMVEGVQARRARDAVSRLAVRTERTPEAIRADVGVLAGHLVAAGLDLPVARAPMPQAGRGRALMEQVERMAAQIRAWLAEKPDQSAAAAAVARLAEAVAAAARLAMDVAHRLVGDPAELLAAWAADPELLVVRVGRLDWLLDGWEPICLLWQLAGSDSARADAMVEALVIAPPFPAEGIGWFRSAPELQRRLAVPAPVQTMRRAGGRMPSEAMALVARNERIRALAP